MELTSSEIQTINAFGPYNHGAWRGRGVTITQEESLTGRAEFLADLIRRTIKEDFSEEDISKMSIADVGCYDGWILEQLADLPFNRMVGIEPRQRNIEKGMIVRKILGLTSRVEYRVGALEDLGTESFDIIVCCGLLHHVEAIGVALDRIRRICKRMIFIETQCLSSSQITSKLVREIEPKDPIYLSRPRLVGLVGHKFESSYYHGSAMGLSVVSIPTVSAVQMFLERAGFEKIRIVVEPQAYWRGGPVRRAAKACCIAARMGDNKLIKSIAEAVEYNALQTSLPEQSVRLIYNTICEGGSLPILSFRERLIVNYATAPSWRSVILLKLVQKVWPDPSQQELIRSFRYAPVEKVTLELGKVLFKNGDYQACIDVLERITTRLNADWRSVYRAFVLMARASAAIGDDKKAMMYRELALTSNSELPQSLFTS